MKTEPKSRSRQMPWQMDPDDYLRHLPVTPDGRPEDRAVIDRTRRFLITCEMTDFLIRAAPWRPDLVFLASGSGIWADILVLRHADGRRLGGAHRGLPYVFRPFRSRGIGAEIVYFSDMHGGLGLSPCRYSESGMRGRLGAWRRHVTRALEADPDAVPLHIKNMLS